MGPTYTAAYTASKAEGGLCTVEAAYRAVQSPVMAEEYERMPQMTTRIPDRLRRQAVEIARQRDERDLIGKGLSVVVRKAIETYVRRHRHLLPPELRDHDASS